jgi:hypothetical protein
MTKWDTIQADVSDAYVYLDEELAEELGDFANVIEIDHLTDEQVDNIWDILKDI